MIRRTRGRFRLLVFLARKSLFSSRVTVVLLAISIAAGAGFQIANTANLHAFSVALVEEGLTRGGGDIRVEPRDGSMFHDGDAIAAQLQAVPGVIVTIPILLYPGAVGSKGRFVGTPVYGIGATTMPPFHVLSGTGLVPGDRDGILVGSSLAKRLSVEPGDAVELRVIFGVPGAAIDDDNLGRFTVTVRGVVGGSAGAYRFAYVDRAFLAHESGALHGASAILVHLADHESATATAAEITAQLPNVEATGWREDDPYLPNYLRANQTIGAVSYAMVVVAVSVPMWALLYIHVLKRRREIGILAALGFGRGEIFAIYLIQALVVVAIGCVIGALLGLGLIIYFQAHPLFEWETLVVRPAIAFAVFAAPAAAITLTAVIAGSYPAWRAARTDPAQVLRRLE